MIDRAGIKKLLLVNLFDGDRHEIAVFHEKKVPIKETPQTRNGFGIDIASLSQYFKRG